MTTDWDGLRLMHAIMMIVVWGGCITLSILTWYGIYLIVF